MKKENNKKISKTRNTAPKILVWRVLLVLEKCGDRKAKSKGRGYPWA
jgi:hypothetical protein